MSQERPPGEFAAEPPRRPEPPQPADPSPGHLITRVAGVPVYIGRGWFIIGAVILIVFGPQIREAAPWLGPRSYLVAAGYAVLLLLSVLLHEIAHAVSARVCGFQVRQVVADLWGGHTAYDSTRTTPGRSALIAVSGPLTNGLLALLGWWALPYVEGDIARLLVWAATIANAFVAVFNLLPGLPLDGGFILEAAVWKVTGSRALGLIAAGWSGRLLTIAFVVWWLGLPVLQGQAPSLFSLIWILLLGAFLWVGASQAIASGKELRQRRVPRVPPY